MSHDLPIIADGIELPKAERCRSLLCKGMYLNYGLPDDKRVTGDGNYWCGRTQTVLGPDKDFVGDLECRNSGRSCYET